MKELVQLLKLEQAIEIVDIGAADLEGGQKAPYVPLIEAGAARVTGFEPNPDEFAKLTQTDSRRYLPYAVGSGGDAKLYVTQTPGFCSTLKPDMAVAARIQKFARHMKVRETLDIRTRRLDDLDEIERIDFLKIDIQGGEVAVFNGGRTKLASTLAVQTEVAFWPFYEGQPGFADQDRVLQDMGFQLFGMQSVNRFPFEGAPARVRRQSRRADTGPWVDGDALYLRRFESWPELGGDELRRMIALLASICTAISAIAFLCRILEDRNDLTATETQRLLDSL